MPVSIHDLTDCVLLKLTGRPAPSLMKLQKLLYYIQAWHLALHGEPAAEARFEAWAYGPMCRDVFERFSSHRGLYETVDHAQVRPEFSPLSIPAGVSTHIDEVLDGYAGFSELELERMSCSETPWRRARGALPPEARCDTAIDEGVMTRFYARLWDESAAASVD